jgi:hypothetical protein
MALMNATMNGVTANFLFIAELNGYKAGPSMEDKAEYGMNCWLESKFLQLDLSIEKDRKDMYENIWLERIYGDLDKAFSLDGIDGDIKKAMYNAGVDVTLELDETHQWTVPIEIDCAASMLQVMGMLLNDYDLANATNMVEGELTDPWSIEGLTRNMVKKAATPMLYGSSKQAHELWQDEDDMPYTLEDVNTYNKALSTGYLAKANAFKNFLINNAKPTETMVVQLWNDTFEIKCNRFKHVGEVTKAYDIFDTKDNVIKRVFHTTTKAVPDLDQFRRYFPTLCVHGIDSQIMNLLAEYCMDEFGWAIDIHDAIIINPEVAHLVRAKYSEIMGTIRDNRKEILGNFFKSIGISATAQQQWEELQAMVVPLPDDFVCGPMAMK